MWDIKNNAWVTVNNDFLSRVRRFDNDFHEWRSHEWKSLPNRLTSDKNCYLLRHSWKSLSNRLTIDKKSLFTVTNVLFYFLHAILCHEHANPLKTIIERFAIVAKGGIFWLSIVTSPQLICDVTRTRETGIVTSYSSIVIARANWRKCDLH